MLIPRFPIRVVLRLLTLPILSNVLFNADENASQGKAAVQSVVDSYINAFNDDGYCNCSVTILGA